MRKEDRREARRPGRLLYVYISEDPPERTPESKAGSGKPMRLPPHGRPKRCESALQDPQGALRAPPGARRGPLGLWVLLRFRLTLAGPAANPCTVFGVGFAVGVDCEQSCDVVFIMHQLTAEWYTAAVREKRKNLVQGRKREFRTSAVVSFRRSLLNVS